MPNLVRESTSLDVPGATSVAGEVMAGLPFNSALFSAKSRSSSKAIDPVVRSECDSNQWSLDQYATGLVPPVRYLLYRMDGRHRNSS